MSIIYPLDLPAQVPNGLTMSLDFVVSANTSAFTRQQQVYLHPGEQWRAECNFPPMEHDEAQEWITFFMRLRGKYGTFLMGDLSYEGSRGIATGTPLVDGANQKGHTLNTKGWTPSTAGILKTGDYFQLGTGSASRLHKITADANSDSDGKAVLEFAPGVVTSQPNNAAIIVESPKGVFRLTGNSAAWSVANGQQYGLSLQAEEAL